MIDEEDVTDLITLDEAIEAVENAFREKGSGMVQMPPKSYVYFDQFNGDFRVMPAYLEDINVAGVKVVNVHPDNPQKHKLPSVMATIILLDPETGEPISFIGGTKITDYRTGAAGAVAAKYLAKDDSDIVAFIGTGAQARTQIRALDKVLDIEKAWAWSRDETNRNNFVSEMSSVVKFELEIAEGAEEAVKDADLIVTTTPSKTPLVMNEWISDGVHINAIGADAKGKQELDPAILKRAKIVVDEWDQAYHSGEINVPVSEGELTKDDIFAEIGEIVTGKKSVRESEKDVTVFDSTGLAVQDISTSWQVYQKALGESVGKEVNFL